MVIFDIQYIWNYNTVKTFDAYKLKTHSFKLLLPRPGATNRTVTLVYSYQPAESEAY